MDDEAVYEDDEEVLAFLGAVVIDLELIRVRFSDDAAVAPVVRLPADEVEVLADAKVPDDDEDDTDEDAGDKVEEGGEAKEPCIFLTRPAWMELRLGDAPLPVALELPDLCLE